MPRLLTNKEERKITKGIALKKNLVAKLDEMRGLIPRSALINKILEEYLDEHETLENNK